MVGGPPRGSISKRDSVQGKLRARESIEQGLSDSVRIRATLICQPCHSCQAFGEKLYLGLAFLILLFDLGWHGMAGKRMVDYGRNSKDAVSAATANAASATAGLCSGFMSSACGCRA